MSNESNVDNRLRYLVRGRVIVFTNSKFVEFLQEDLRRSYPLYNFFNLQPGQGASFMIEVNGYLTFDENSEVKITNEIQSFSQTYYDPKGFAILTPADPVPPLIISAYLDNSYTQVQPDGSQWFARAIVNVAAAAGQFTSYEFTHSSFVPEADFYPLSGAAFVANSLFAGVNAYANWTGRKI